MQPQVSMHLTASLGELAIFVSGRTTEIWWPPEVLLLIRLHVCAQQIVWQRPASKPVQQADAKVGATAYALHSHHCLCPVEHVEHVMVCTIVRSWQNCRHTEVV